MGLSDFLKSMFGNKSTRDLKKITPIVNQIKAIYPEIDALDIDSLRQRTADIRQQLNDSVQDKRDEIDRIKAEIETLDYEEREPLWKKVDDIQKEILDVLEDKLNEVLPTVFAIVKSTARRFAENETITVTATQLDRDLAAQGKDFVTIDGDKAIYNNHWIAGGNDLRWDMKSLPWAARSRSSWVALTTMVSFSANLLAVDFTMANTVGSTSLSLSSRTSRISFWISSTFFHSGSRSS